MYTVKEIYKTLQGEGAHTGRAAVFLRFSGCNLWTGLERDRAKAACQFCDTDFAGADGPGGGKFADAAALADSAFECWVGTVGSPPSPPASRPRGMPSQRAQPTPLSRYGIGAGGEREQPATPYIVCTGGEPLLQLDAPLIEALHARSFEIAIETNGTQIPPPGIDWICVSPKADAPLVLASGDELKLVFPQAGADPQAFERLDFRHFFLQPMDGANARANIEAAARYCLDHPRWRLSLQTHKLIGLP